MVAVEKNECWAVGHIKEGQVAYTAVEFCQACVARDIEFLQLSQVTDVEAGQLVVAGPQRLQVGHVGHTGQLGDGTVLTVQVGQRGATLQVVDGVQVGVVETAEVL